MRVRLTQIDGALPNLALMRLASWHRERGDEIHFTRHLEPADLWDLGYDLVYGSVLFDFSGDRLARFRKAWPKAIVGGTGAGMCSSVPNMPYCCEGYPMADSVSPDEQNRGSQGAGETMPVTEPVRRPASLTSKPMTVNEALHIVRNPWGLPHDVLRPARLLLADEVERLGKALDRYGRHAHPNCHDLTLNADGSFGPRNGCLCGLDAVLSGEPRSSVETSLRPRHKVGDEVTILGARPGYRVMDVLIRYKLVHPDGSDLSADEQFVRPSEKASDECLNQQCRATGECVGTQPCTLVHPPCSITNMWQCGSCRTFNPLLDLRCQKCGAVNGRDE